MRGIYALAAIIRKTSELATDAERYALAELHKPTESLNCKYSNFLLLNFWNKNDPLILFA